MKPTKADLRRTLAAAFTATAAGGAAVAALMAPSATAASDPCAASEVARTVGRVATNTGNYLDAHPQTNQALTTISQQQAGPATLAALKTYFDANPQVAKDMQQLQQPLQALGTRCKLPVTLPQVMGLMQGAQQQVGATGGLPVPGVAAPTQSSPASAATQGAGPLPGPRTTTSR
ncbi:hemophore [Mycolicibacterium sp. XJ870]